MRPYLDCVQTKAMRASAIRIGIVLIVRHDELVYIGQKTDLCSDFSRRVAHPPMGIWEQSEGDVSSSVAARVALGAVSIPRRFVTGSFWGKQGFLQEQLDLVGINRATLFPDLGSAAKYLTWSIYQRKRHSRGRSPLASMRAIGARMGPN